MQLVGDLFIELGLTDEIDDLPFPKAESGIEGLLGLGTPAVGTDSVVASATELFATPKAASQKIDLSELDRGHR